MAWTGSVMREGIIIMGRLIKIIGLVLTLWPLISRCDAGARARLRPADRDAQRFNPLPSDFLLSQRITKRLRYLGRQYAEDRGPGRIRLVERDA